MHGEMRNSYTGWLENLKGVDHLEDLSVDGKILVLILGKYSEKLWIEFIWLKSGTSGGPIEHCNRASDP
jgi:hypothetical protein